MKERIFGAVLLVSGLLDLYLVFGGLGLDAGWRYIMAGLFVVVGAVFLLSGKA